tara:strand:+ start:845 stop:1720 length:876 start_codon:yes stop_codon:yes gene_type:complete
MADRYFDKFPQITHNNTKSIDITRRVKIIDDVYNNPYVFNTYDISDSERADQFSYRYYNDEYKSWILYFSNKIVDPYYEWYLDENDLSSHIIEKYGSLEDAKQKVLYYRNDWANDDLLETNGFEALAPALKKYWQPIYDQSGRILEYQRFKKDWKISTNRIMSYSVSNTNFVKDEICDIVFNSINSGKGQVVSTSNTKVYIQHVSGVYQSNTEVEISGSSYIFGNDSGVNTIFTDSILQSNNISPEEDVYWSPVYQFDDVVEKNEFNRTIKVLDSNQSRRIVLNLIEAFED